MPYPTFLHASEPSTRARNPEEADNQSANGPFPDGNAPPALQFTDVDGEDGLVIHNYDQMRPFLMHIASDQDHWVYIGSNGAVAAGRRSPEHALFPYYTDDKMFDLADSIGGLTLLRVKTGSAEWASWEPLRLEEPKGAGVERSLYKSASCTKLIFEEYHRVLGLRLRVMWTVSARFGIVRRCELTNETDVPAQLELLDGVQNIVPAGLTDEFQNQFSNLANAYKRCELLQPEGIGLYYLNSIPTDKAEPSEGLRATVVWAHGLDNPVHLLTNRQVDSFRRGEAVQAEEQTRGIRGSYLLNTSISLEPRASKTWWLAADLDKSAADVIRLREWLSSRESRPAQELQANVDRSSEHLREIIGAADGLQEGEDRLRTTRHYSNTLYNVLRGGIFAHGYEVPREDLIRTLEHFNREVFARHHGWLEALPERIDHGTLMENAEAQGDPHLLRLLHEYLPLVFSRRHGDPSRPWNRFSIELTDAAGDPQYTYEGNWRDIFQNWEALLQSYPDYTESAIFRFVNASTADGHNPYRITKDGFDWEVMDPDEPWSNIGYWGDHQIIYLLKLLESSHRFHPAKLRAFLSKRLFSYAHVPYRIKPFEDVLRDPRDSITFSNDDVEAIQERVKELGADGKTLPAPDGSVYLVTLAEKLLVPLMAKLASLVPGGGIWMNTQRPEWNDANNALAGYGLSVVTLGYVHRYLVFMESLFNEAGVPEELELSREVADWLDQQAKPLEQLSADPTPLTDPAARESVVRSLGESASRYRLGIYQNGFSGQVALVSLGDLKSYLRAARTAVAASLRANRREDGLYHAYNVLDHEKSGIGLRYLDEMLEGQVSILSAKLLKCDEAADLIDALRASPLHEEKHGSFILYPDKELPSFLEKGRLKAPEARQSQLLSLMLDADDRCIVEQAPDGFVRFNGSFRNSGDMRKALAALRKPEYRKLVEKEADTIAELFDTAFNHRAFTGRSSSFFAYEGLGSIYWHMVSKLVLAVQENYLAAVEQSANKSTLARLQAHYREMLEGLGLHKSPEVYGAFPTDPYSHTPKHAGAQQPGMTGQVKEDLLCRLGELGVHVEAGKLSFRPNGLLSKDEFASAASTFRYFGLDGRWHDLPLPRHSLAFTYCQVPVIYQLADGFSLKLHYADGREESREVSQLDAAESAELFARTGEIARICVAIPESYTPKAR